jgi:biotin-[acetyl-CoA-carboxylase] ligase BirA-like protein
VRGTRKQLQNPLPLAHPDTRAVHVESCTSTNDVARQVLEAPDSPNAVIVCADYQDAGHGRLDHVWHSPKGLNLLCTLGIKPQKVGYKIDPRLPLCAGALVQRAIKNCTGVRLLCKWPNDLVTEDGRKVAGILILNKSEAIYIGIGVNVNSLRTDYPDELLGKVATLRELSGKEIDRNELLFPIMIQLMNYFTGRPGFLSGEMVDYWLESARPFGEPIIVQLGEKPEKVIPLWIVPATGELLVIKEDGTESTLSSADYIDYDPLSLSSSCANLRESRSHLSSVT